MWGLTTSSPTPALPGLPGPGSQSPPLRPPVHNKGGSLPRQRTDFSSRSEELRTQTTESRHSQHSIPRRATLTVPFPVFIRHSGQTRCHQFDFESKSTPSLPVKLLVSPLSGQKTRQARQSLGVAHLIVANVSTNPSADYTNEVGMRQLMKTPDPLPKSQMNDLTNVGGIKQLMATPRIPTKGPKNDLSEVQGIKKLMATPRSPAKGPKNDCPTSEE